MEGGGKEGRKYRGGDSVKGRKRANGKFAKMMQSRLWSGAAAKIDQEVGARSATAGAELPLAKGSFLPVLK
jgi:hypothetical protein